MQAVALVIFVLQMIFVLQKYLDQPLMSSPGTKKLSTEMLVLVAVCKTSQFDLVNAKNLKYEYIANFVTGELQESSFISWTGPYGNMTFNETLDALFNPGLEDVYFDKNIEAIKNKFLLPHGVCKFFEGTPGKSIAIDIAERSDYTVTVTDPAAAVHFRLADHMMTGDIIKVQTDLTKQVIVNYLIQLTETSIETGDGSCIEYPNKHYKTFADCVDDELKDIISPVLGCMVPWISKSDMCYGLIQKLPKHDYILEKLFSIILSSWTGQAHQSDTCVPQCKRMSANSKYLSTRASFISKDRIYLNFDENIKVKRIVLAYDFGTFLVEIGSALGLWLGLSVIGVFDVLVSGFIKIWKLMQRCF